MNKHSVFYSQGFRKNQLRNNFGVFLTFFKVVLVLFVQKWKVKNIAFKGVDIFTDSVAAKSIAEGTGQVRKVKHLDTHQHIVRQMVLEGKANLHWISSKDNISDLLTKHVGNHRLFLSLRDMCLSQLA